MPNASSDSAEGSRTSIVLVGVLTLCWVISFYDPPYPKHQLLHHAPMPVAIPFLFYVARRSWMSTASMACAVCFLLLHVVGARYLYSRVPFGELLTWLSLGGDFENRNHYDRLVHLLFGFLAVLPTVEISTRYAGVRPRPAKLLAITIVLAVSALYELFEWLLTVIASPQDAERYNGQQGDLWDAHKDMALATLGAVLVAPFVCRRAKPADG